MVIPVALLRVLFSIQFCRAAYNVSRNCTRNRLFRYVVLIAVLNAFVRF